MKSLIVTMIIGLVLSISAVAFAQEVYSGSEADLLQGILAAARAGDWWVTFGGALLAVVFIARLLLGKWSKFKKLVNESDVGGTLFTFAVSFIGMLGTTLFAGAKPSWADAKMAFLFGVVAAGGWSVIYKRLAVPTAKKIASLF